MKKIKYSILKNKLHSNSIEVLSSIGEDETFNRLNSISRANKDDLSFFSNILYVDELQNCKAKACLINHEHSKYLPKNCQPIIVKNVYLAFAYVAEFFSEIRQSNGVISSLTNIDNNSKLHHNIQIKPFTNIEENTEIFDNVIIGSNCNIGPNVTIQKNCIIHDNVSITNSIIKEGCEIKSGSRIGLSGFGFEENTKKKIAHIGNVIIEKFSTIGSNTTIDRAVLHSTSIGEFSQIDNLVQIAHNVTIGKHAIIAAQVGIAGSTNIGNFVKIGGQSGISGHLNIGNNVTIAGKSGVTKNIDDNKVIAGFPAKDINKWKREIIKLGR